MPNSLPALGGQLVSGFGLGPDPARNASTVAQAVSFRVSVQTNHAVALLANSIVLNVDKGSPIGLAFNRQALGALTSAAAQAHGPDAEQLRGTVADLASRLAQAEAILGRVGLPEEASGQTVAS